MTLPLDAFGVKKVHAQVKRWMKAGSPAAGPLAWPSPEEVLADVTECGKLAKGAPDGPFPAARLRSVHGVPIYVVLETGELITLHHDATLYEVAAECVAPGQTPSELARALAARGGVLKLDALRALADAIADWPSLYPPQMSEATRIRAIARGLGLDPIKLRALHARNELALELFGFDAQVLDDVAAAESKLKKLSAKKPAKKIDLSDCWLDHWPEGLDGLPVEDLDLSNNPDLPWSTLDEQLRALGNLRVLRVAGNDLGDGVELAAKLPGVKVRAVPAGKLAVLAAQLRAPADVREVDLCGASLKKLPAGLEALTALEVLDLSDNPKLDWEDTCRRLAGLGSLREVRFARCGLDHPPSALSALSQLERVSFAGDGHMLKHANRFLTVGPKIALLRHLPRLRRAVLGDFPRTSIFYTVPIEAPKPDALALPPMPELEEVSLNVESPDYLPAIVDWLAEMPRLRSLTLSLPYGDIAPIARLTGLRALRVSGRGAQALSGVLDAMPGLEVLSFPWHELRPEKQQGALVEFPPGIRRMKGLRELSIAWGEHGKLFRAKCGELPAWLSELPLESFRYEERNDDGGLGGVPSVLGAMRTLRRLVLSFRAARAHWDPAIADLDLTLLEVRASFGSLPDRLVVPRGLERLALGRAPDNLSVLSRLESLSLSESLDAATVADLASLPLLRELHAFWPDDAPLPAALTQLVKVTGGGALPSLPMLEEASLYRDDPFPAEGLPRLKKLSWGPRGDGWRDAVKKLAACPQLRELSIGSFWPKDRTLPEGFRALRQLDELVFFNTAFNRNAKAKAQLAEWLPECRVRMS